MNSNCKFYIIVLNLWCFSSRRNCTCPHFFIIIYAVLQGLFIFVSSYVSIYTGSQKKHSQYETFSLLFFESLNSLSHSFGSAVKRSNQCSSIYLFIMK